FRSSTSRWYCTRIRPVSTIVRTVNAKAAAADGARHHARKSKPLILAVHIATQSTVNVTTPIFPRRCAARIRSRRGFPAALERESACIHARSHIRAYQNFFAAIEMPGCFAHALYRRECVVDRQQLRACAASGPDRLDDGRGRFDGATSLVRGGSSE